MKTIMEVFPGFSINDIMDTDYEALIKVIQSKTPEKEKSKQAVQLKDFIKNM